MMPRWRTTRAKLAMAAASSQPLRTGHAIAQCTRRGAVEAAHGAHDEPVERRLRHVHRPGHGRRAVDLQRNRLSRPPRGGQCKLAPRNWTSSRLSVGLCTRLMKERMALRTAAASASVHAAASTG